MYVHRIGPLIALAVAHIGGVAAIPAYQPLYQYAGRGGSQVVTPAQIAAPLALTGLEQTGLSPIANIQSVQFMPGPQIPAVQQQVGLGDSTLGRLAVGSSAEYTHGIDSKIQGSRIQRLQHQNIPGYSKPVVDSIDSDEMVAIPKINHGDPVIPFQRRPGVGRLPSVQPDTLVDQLSDSTSIAADGGGWPPSFDSTSSPDHSNDDEPLSETVINSSSDEPETSAMSAIVPPPPHKKPVEIKKATPKVVSTAPAATPKTEKHTPTEITNSCVATSNTAA
ncbi:hypothetical protein IW150_002347, partial [Coemansia sp. RSA 2607]